MTYEHVLNLDEQKELLRIARTTVKEFLVSGRTPPGAPHKRSLTAPAGVFVSFHEGEALRGCIGTTQESQPIYKAVQEMAIAAATRDPRYRAVRTDELAAMTIEISVLGDRRPMGAPSDIVIGKHGLQVTATSGTRPQRGLLLPKVAVDHGWDAEMFLVRTCEKAGLPPEWWRGNEAHVELFTAQVFDEKSLHVGPFADT
jgi:AmmeMemoRadiSam system protein A